LENIELQGIGTNLGCYGALENTREKMEELVRDAEIVEEAIGRKLQYISGGGTLAMPRLFDETMPKRVNHLRIGEAI
ncbi:alanine/ornithine racemase family PLP-dependent enzyme, partial [Acinetobacter sp. 163]|nr:alanine/ornithine racemase family PLP-dependent enzyme [Acinetobacter sp. 163]